MKPIKTLLLVVTLLVPLSLMAEPKLQQCTSSPQVEYCYNNSLLKDKNAHNYFCEPNVSNNMASTIVYCSGETSKINSESCCCLNGSPESDINVCDPRD